jgi:ParB family chromosome partitioning protein
MSDFIHIPLNRLTLWDGNVRKTDIRVGIEELADSIAAHGLLQSLVVRKAKRGKYEIVAGQRRFLALQELAERGVFEADCAIPCLVVNGELDATELSLAENTVRAPMHPADQFEAIRAIIDDGASVADVAARFGLAESTVTKRLKLGRLSPVILAAYRAGDIDLDEAQAFAITDDHAAQERVLADLPDWNRDPASIRRSLTEDEIPSTDKRVRFIGLDVYRDAGGVVRQDLFDDTDRGYLTDPALLDRLVSEKLSAIAQSVSAEGFSWVEILPDADYGILGGYKRLHPDHAPLPESEQAELDKLSQEYDELIDSDDFDDDHLSEVEQRIEALSASREFWSAETLAVAGAIISLGYNGEARIERGLVRKADAHKLAVNDDTAGHSEADTRPAVFSPRLVEDLTAQRSAAIGAELMAQPDIALAAIVHALALDTFLIGRDASCLKLRMMRPSLKRAMASPSECQGLTAVEQEFSRIGDRLPGAPQNLFQWLLGLTRDELLAILALIAARSVDVVERKDDRRDSARLKHGDDLAQALNLDIGNWYVPTAANYFARVSKAQILADIDDAKGSHAPSLDKLKKTELAVRAEALIAGSGWIPHPLRANMETTPAPDEETALAAE